MSLPRVRFTVRRLMAVVLVSSVILAWVPWPLTALVAGAIIPPMIVEGWTVIGWGLAYSITGILLGLLMPPVVTDCRKIPTRPPTASPAAGPPPAGPPLLEEMDNGLTGISTSLYDDRGR